MKKDSFDIGDIVENKWADDDNPIKRMIYIGHQKYLCMDGMIICISSPDLEGEGPLYKIGCALVSNWRSLLGQRE